MYPIVLNADENYIKYTSVLMTNIIYKIDTNANFAKSYPFSHFNQDFNTKTQKTIF